MTEIKTTSRTVLRRLLRYYDRKLNYWDHIGKYHPPECAIFYGAMRTLDARRREIRRRLKERR